MTFVPKQPERALFWLISVAALIAAVALLRPPDDTFMWKALFDAGHAVLSGYLALAFLQMALAWTGSAATSARHHAVAFALTFVSGALVEFVQFFLPRDADPWDLFRDGVGAGAFLLGLQALQRDSSGRFVRSRSARLGFLGLGAALLAIAFIPAGLLGITYMQRNAAFPRLCDFESRWEERFVIVHRAELKRLPPPPGWSRRLSRDGAERVGRLEFQTGTYPGFGLKETAPDWRRYQTLVFEVYSELEAATELTLRVDDAEHNELYTDRFNRVLTISPGAQEIRIPLAEIRTAPRGREMDMAHIRQVILFAVEPPRPFTLYVDRFRLE